MPKYPLPKQILGTGPLDHVIFSFSKNFPSRRQLVGRKTMVTVDLWAKAATLKHQLVPDPNVVLNGLKAAPKEISHHLKATANSKDAGGRSQSRTQKCCFGLIALRTLTQVVSSAQQDPVGPQLCENFRGHFGDIWHQHGERTCLDNEAGDPLVECISCFRAVGKFVHAARN